VLSFLFDIVSTNLVCNTLFGLFFSHFISVIQEVLNTKTSVCIVCKINAKLHFMLILFFIIMNAMPSIPFCIYFIEFSHVIRPVNFSLGYKSIPFMD